MDRASAGSWVGGQGERERDRERDSAPVLLCSPEIVLSWVQDEPGVFSKPLINFPKLLWAF